jgi:hypothetical protein
MWVKGGWSVEGRWVGSVWEVGGESVERETHIPSIGCVEQISHLNSVSFVFHAACNKIQPTHRHAQSCKAACPEGRQQLAPLIAARKGVRNPCDPHAPEDATSMGANRTNVQLPHLQCAAC